MGVNSSSNSSPVGLVFFIVAYNKVFLVKKSAYSINTAHVHVIINCQLEHGTMHWVRTCVWVCFIQVALYTSSLPHTLTLALNLSIHLCIFYFQINAGMYAVIILIIVHFLWDKHLKSFIRDELTLYITYISKGLF